MYSTEIIKDFLKKFVAFIIFFLFTANGIFACVDAPYDITGRWAEKISERVVMDIYFDNKKDQYKIFITWREDNLAQKDIYRFSGKSDNSNNIKYKNYNK